MSTEIHPEFHRFLTPQDKEHLLGQQGAVFWLYGLSGSGKSTLANAAERFLHQEGYLTTILDGDNLRSGLNQDLGFSEEDRQENIRRIAQVAHLFAGTGILTFVSAITPKNALRQMARQIVGTQIPFKEIYVHASFEACTQRDPKGLYQKAQLGHLRRFSGQDSPFEPPSHPDLMINTENRSLERCIEELRVNLRHWMNVDQNIQSLRIVT